MSNSPDLVARWPMLDIQARQTRLASSLTCAPGPLASTLQVLAAEAARVARGLWQRDPSVWTPEAHAQARIANRLGWLESPAVMADDLARLEAFGERVTQEGFTDVVLLGMGGSSLAPETLRAISGSAHGGPTLHVLDSTDPGAILAIDPPLNRTLFILASKSGTTIEPNSLAAYFRQALLDAGIRTWADHFVAITDEGTELDQRARTDGFFEVFINPSDIGGRYSALSFFGLVPAAVMRQDVRALVGWGLAMLAAGRLDTGDVLANPAVGLGTMLGCAARAGRDKLTLLLPLELEPFGLWVEQLVAESTGKSGVGVVPIVGETVAEPGAYGDDRLFVHVRLKDSRDRTCEATVNDLREAGAPVAVLDVESVSALGAEFVRWEIATAVAGGMLGIDPFDEPNVQQAKDATRTLLAGYRSQGRLPAATPDNTSADGIELTLTGTARERLGGRGPEHFLALIEPRDYVAVLAYVGPDDELAAALHAFRMAVRDHTGAATTFGYGPRYLHSTGQLHKGGANSGIFVVITAVSRVDMPIPGQAESFGTLELAQALGDFSSLDATGRRALHVHLPAPERHLLQPVLEALLNHTGRG